MRRHIVGLDMPSILAASVWFPLVSCNVLRVFSRAIISLALSSEMLGLNNAVVRVSVV